MVHDKILNCIPSTDGCGGSDVGRYMTDVKLQSGNGQSHATGTKRCAARFGTILQGQCGQVTSCSRGENNEIKIGIHELLVIKNGNPLRGGHGVIECETFLKGR